MRWRAFGVACVWHDRAMGSLADAEAAFLAAREAWDQHGIAVARGLDGLAAMAAEADRLTELAREGLARATDPSTADDRRALETMRRRIDEMGASDDGDAGEGLDAAFTAASQTLYVDGEAIQRLAILAGSRASRGATVAATCSSRCSRCGAPSMGMAGRCRRTAT